MLLKCHDAFPKLGVPTSERRGKNTSYLATCGKPLSLSGETKTKKNFCLLWRSKKGTFGLEKTYLRQSTRVAIVSVCGKILLFAVSSLFGRRRRHAAPRTTPLIKDSSFPTNCCREFFYFLGLEMRGMRDQSTEEEEEEKEDGTSCMQKKKKKE